MTIVNFLFLILGIEIGLMMMEPSIIKAGCIVGVAVLILLKLR